MKTIKLTALVLSFMSIMMSCNKSNDLTNTNPLNVDQVSSSSKLGGAQGKNFIVPSNFVSGIDNPYFPLTPGDTFYFHTDAVEDGDSVHEVSYMAVTNDIKVIAGINCTVVHDIAYVNDTTLLEDTYDWFAQDIYGTVWYLGEYTIKYDSNGVASTEGSFEHGVDGARGGIIMARTPGQFIGVSYRQEYYVGQAQDKGEIVSVNETVTIPFGTFTNCVETKETSPLDPGVIEYKWYAQGYGQIKASITTGGDELNILDGTNF